MLKCLHSVPAITQLLRLLLCVLRDEKSFPTSLSKIKGKVHGLLPSQSIGDGREGVQGHGSHFELCTRKQTLYRAGDAVKQMLSFQQHGVGVMGSVGCFTFFAK